MSRRTLGGLLLIVVLSLVGSRGNAAEEKEVKVKFADCPVAVQKTLQREANGATISEVDKELEDGKTIYEVDVKIDGKNYEIKVAPDGTLISKSLDDEEEDDEDEDK